jgi:hypothetical protein
LQIYGKANLREGQSIAKRLIHLRIRSQSDDPAALFSFLRAAVPFYESLPGICIRLLRSLEDASRFIEVVQYETEEIYEADQVRVNSDPEMQTYLSSWRSLLREGVAVETYEDVTDQIRSRDDADP